MADSSRITITICGDGGCGKSSITLRLVRSQWTSDYDPTIEDSYSITRRIDGQTYHLSLTDTAGQEEYRGMWGGSNLKSDAFLMVYDITSLQSLEALEYFNDLVDMEAETRFDVAATTVRGGHHKGAQQKHGAGAIMPVKIVAGNKCDLQESRQVDAKTGLEWARRRGCGFMETSARNVVNIEETFALIVRRVVEARRRAALELSGESPAGAVDGHLKVNTAGGMPGQGLKFDAGGTGTRRAVTAPLSPLPVNEKADGWRGKDRRIGGDGGFWGKLRCW
jgi:GTPase KRas